MNQFSCLILLVSLMMTTGCATVATNLMGRRTIYDGPRGATVSTNGNIVIKDVRYEHPRITTPSSTDQVVTQRYYCVSQADILTMTNQVFSRTNYLYGATGQVMVVTRHLQVDYHQFPIDNLSQPVKFINSALASSNSRQRFTYEGEDVWPIQAGFGGFHPMQYPLLNSTINLEMGPTHGHVVGEYKKTWARILFPVLIVPAVATDIVLFPFTIVFISTIKIWHD